MAVTHSFHLVPSGMGDHFSISFFVSFLCGSLYIYETYYVLSELKLTVNQIGSRDGSPFTLCETFDRPRYILLIHLSWFFIHTYSILYIFL